jgi:site-specific recombinase XerD
METVNASAGTVRPEHIVSIVDFVDTVYLPWVRENKRAATINGYTKIWKKHLKEHFGKMLLREYQPHDATRFLTRLAEKGMGLNAVNHVRALMSGIFKHAAALGYVNSNPDPLGQSVSHASGAQRNATLYRA